MGSNGEKNMSFWFILFNFHQNQSLTRQTKTPYSDYLLTVFNNPTNSYFAERFPSLLLVSLLKCVKSR